MMFINKQLQYTGGQCAFGASFYNLGGFMDPFEHGKFYFCFGFDEARVVN